MNFIARARATEELLALLPTLGITLAADQTLAQAIQARLAVPPVAAPAADHTAAMATLAAELEQAGNNLATAQASLTSTTAQLTAATAQSTLFATALSAKGIKITAADPKVGITAADIDAAIEARISTKSAELLAATGTPPVTATAAAGGHSAKGAAGTITLAAFKALAPRERFAFATLGGRCTE